jgi:hypothetical protein
VVQRCAAEGVNPGLALPEENALLVAITELRSREEIDRLADVLSRAVVREAAGTTHDDARALVAASGVVGV